MSGNQTGPGTPRPDQPLDARAAFLTEYDRLLRRGTVPFESIDLHSEFGMTRVHASGPPDAPALLLFPGYQATAAVWIPLIDALGDERRVYAVDPIGDAGSSVAGARRVATPADLVEWIDGVLDGLGLQGAEFGGHSYGAWMALAYAIAHPERVEALTLLDPTMTFAPLLKGYIFRAIPALIAPTAARRRSVIGWETRDAELDPEWLQLTSTAADLFGDAPTVPTKIPPAQALSALQMPVLVIVAGRSRVHQVSTVAKRAGGRIPHARVETLLNATHYGLPMTHAEQIAAQMTAPPP